VGILEQKILEQSKQSRDKKEIWGIRNIWGEE
jgi:hypothetical protein